MANSVARYEKGDVAPDVREPRFFPEDSPEVRDFLTKLSQDQDWWSSPTALEQFYRLSQLPGITGRVQALLYRRGVNINVVLAETEKWANNNQEESVMKDLNDLLLEQ